MKDRIAAALLAFFLGGFGAQFFYLGNFGWGILCVLFFWSGIPAVIGIIQGLIWIFGTQEAFDAKYNLRKNDLPLSDGARYDALERVHSLKEKGILSESQYDAEKAKLLGK